MASPTARKLRAAPTDAERALWARLRQRQLDSHRFRRQHPIGPYVVDFFCAERDLIVEVDGGQHAEDVVADTRRTAWLEARGYRVVRFWNNDVLENVDGVLDELRRALRDPPPP